MTARVSGLRELRRRIRELPIELRNGMWQEMRTDARALRDELRRVAPRKSGTLRRNIKTTLRKGSLFAAVTIGDEAFYWRFLEFGTRRMSAKPFVRPVWDSQKTKIRQRLDEAIQRELNRRAQ